MTFSICPIEMWSDKRLTHEQLRVLGAILSFRGKDTNVVWPRRAEIAKRCGIHPSNISAATTALVRLGWLSKDGKGGHSKATRYTITVPETVAERATVVESATVADQARGGVAESATRMPVADQATRKEDTNEETIRRDQLEIARAKKPPSSARTKFDPLSQLIDLGVTKQVAADYLEHRKAKRAPVTATVIEQTKSEAAKAEMTLHEALVMICANGWQGFKADWVANSSARHSPAKRRPTTENFDHVDYGQSGLI